MKKKNAFFYYLNPKNVSAAILAYGYTYRIYNTVFLYVIVTALSVAGGWLFQLGPLEIGMIAVCAMAMTPAVFVNGYKNMYEQKRFSDVNMYMEQVLYSFLKTPQIIVALQDVRKILPKDSPMRHTLGEAIQRILRDSNGEHSLENALAHIEENYPCQRVKDAHALMLRAEQIGGDYDRAVKILLSSRAIWEKETCRFQKECKNRQRLVNMALLLVCTVCLFTPLTILKFTVTVDITSLQAYRTGTALMILSSMYTYVKTDYMASINWLQNESALTKEEQRKLYRKVMEFDRFKEKKKSMLWAGITAGIGIFFYFLKWNYFTAVCALLFLLLRNQHNVGYQLAKRRCRDEIIKAFPQWLMEISLLLQVSDNVNGAIAKSVEQAPEILLDELKKLQNQIMENPESNEPYMNFMKEFQIPEIPSAMGMLYALSSGRGGNADAQIEEILSKNASLLAQSEQMANENRLASLYWKFLIPSIIGGGKLLLDMTLVMITFLSSNLY